MIYNFDEYKTFVNDLFRKIPCMKTEQLKQFFIRYYKMNESDAWTIILGLQRAENFWLSCDGWAMTKPMYQKFTGDRFKEHIIYGDIYNLGNMDSAASKYKPDLIKCLWLIIDMLPQSINFVVSEAPYNFMFTFTPQTEGEVLNSRLYQLVYISKTNEIALPQMLKAMPKIQDKTTREVMRRIALVDDEESVWRIPYIGFSQIVLYNDDGPKHCIKIDTPDAIRPKDIRWKDEDN